MTKTARRQDLGLGKTARGGSGGSFAAHERETSAPPPLSEHSLDQHFDTLEEKIDAMSREVVDAVERLKSDDGWNRYLDTMSQFHHYSMANQMLISIQKPDATHVGGKTMWRQMGRELKPFEERGHGISIFRPVTGWKDRTDRQGNVLRGADGKPLRDRVVFKYSTSTIYDISQTTGDPLPDGGIVELSETPPPGLESDADTAIESFGYTLHEEELREGFGGYTTLHGPKRVVVRKGLSDAERVRVKFHELGHIAADHVNKDRFDEYHTGAGGQRGAMEIEAESIAHVMLRMNGMQPTERTSRYVAGWSTVQGGDPEAVKNAAAGVQRAVKTLISEHGWQNVQVPERPEYVPKKRPAKANGE